MNRLVIEIETQIRARMRSACSALPDDGVLRSVFHGPPLPYLRRLLSNLTADGGLEVPLRSGKQVVVPVLLPLGDFPDGMTNPLVGSSGICDESHILALRNTPACPRFLTLAAPGRGSILSIAQATENFGVSADPSDGGLGIDAWWADEFVQKLARAAARKGGWTTEAHREPAFKLLERAIRAGDEADRHDLEHPNAWAALSRAFAAFDLSLAPFATYWSMICGFPPMTDGSLRWREQTRVLDRLAEAAGDEGFATCLARLQENASEAEASALAECFEHLKRGCEVRPALARSAPYYYAPYREDSVGDPAIWWRVLPAERLAELLEDDDSPAEGLSLALEGVALQSGQGLPNIVLDTVRLRVQRRDDSQGEVDLIVIRQAGGRSGRREWPLKVPTIDAVVDSEIPDHSRPIRYVAQSAGYRDATVRVISLQHWEPGVVVAGRTARKISPPKRSSKGSGIDFECSLVVEGEGRHFLDLLVGGRTTVGEKVQGVDASDTVHDSLECRVSSAGPQAYGLEIFATVDCHFLVELCDLRDGSRKTLRINVSCEELPAEGCRSQFEKLIGLNRIRKEGVASSAVVQLNRQVRVADLQAWYLDPLQVSRSFYPLVIAPDCGVAWGPPGWGSPSATVLSQGRFLHDPRPSVEEFVPPDGFLAARAEIAERIRGRDGHGMVEAAELGVWLKEQEFCNLVDAYARTYLKWLEAEPDVASWVDIALVCGLENDRKTLQQEPDAIVVSPLHPLRIAWHCLAQRVLFESWRAGQPCPAASILDPDGVPSVLSLALRTPGGTPKRVHFLSIECSSDYWAILWNGDRLAQLASGAELQPFDSNFGIQLGGVSSGFSASQVNRSLDDVAVLLCAKPTLNVLVASSSGHNDSCNEGLLSWARERFGTHEDEGATSIALGPRLLQIFDERKASAQPEAATVANLTEDTRGSARWFSAIPGGTKPDLAIVAQLETSNSSVEETEYGSPVGVGALIRHRVRTQLQAGAGAFLTESRMGIERAPSGEGIADLAMRAVVRLENLGEVRVGYTFAPSVQAIRYLFREKAAEYVALSSSAVDPACFLGGWLDDAYLWDYELPSYSHRAGDTNGYYLLSQVKQVDCEALRILVAQLPGCEDIEEATLRELLLEVARRGIPTVRGLSANHSGATGDLGLFLAGRFLQDEFRSGDDSPKSLLPMRTRSEGSEEIALVMPVDPFRGYLQDLQRAVGQNQFLRPDLLVAGLEVRDSVVKCKLTPVEVKYRRQESMAPTACREALEQARSLSTLLLSLKRRADSPELLLWRLAFQHFLISMLDFGFRVYSQQRSILETSRDWSETHQRVVAAVLADELVLEVDPTGRLIVFDGRATSLPSDLDEDGFEETVAICPNDAAQIASGVPGDFYRRVKNQIGTWRLFPVASGVLARAVPEAPSASVTKALPPSVDWRPHPDTGESPSLEEERNAISSGSAGKMKSELISPPALPSPSLEIGGATGAPQKGMQVLVGKSVDGFGSEERFFCPSNTNLNQLNIGVVGDLGTGKTQLVKALLYQMENGAQENRGIKPRVLILDYKRDYSDPEFVAAVGAKVVAPQHLPLNLFDTSSLTSEMVPWMSRYKFFADVLDKIYSNVGPMQRQNLKQAVRDAHESSIAAGRQATIYDVKAAYSARVQGKMDSPLAIISDMVDMELFARDPGATGSFGRFLDGVVVLSLDALGQDDRTKNVLVAIILNLFYEHMLLIEKRPYVGVDPQLRAVDSILLVDEAENIMKFEFDVLKKVLLQGREFGVGVILASQYLRHFKAGATDYREPLLTWFIHKVPNISSQELSSLGLTEDTVQLATRIRKLPNHHCLYKTFDVGGEIIRGQPFFELCPKR